MAAGDTRNSGRRADLGDKSVEDSRFELAGLPNTLQVCGPGFTIPADVRHEE